MHYMRHPEIIEFLGVQKINTFPMGSNIHGYTCEYTIKNVLLEVEISFEPAEQQDIASAQKLKLQLGEAL